MEWKRTDPCVSEKLCEETVVDIYKSVARCAKECPPFERLRNVLSSLQQSVESCARGSRSMLTRSSCILRLTLDTTNSIKT
eukprot:520619-Amphidinium_carterae.1